MCLCVCMSGDTFGGQEHWISLELKFQVVMQHLAWVLTILCKSSTCSEPLGHLPGLFLN